MNETTHTRCQSGDICTEPGSYRFDGYVSGRRQPPPGVEESSITLGIGELFPPVQIPRRGCYWKPLDRTPPLPAAYDAANPRSD